MLGESAASIDARISSHAAELHSKYVIVYFWFFVFNRSNFLSQSLAITAREKMKSAADDNDDDDDDAFLYEGSDKLLLLFEDKQQTSRRVRDIKKIHSSIMEVNLLFQDLGSMVVEQGTLLDRIDQNITISVQYTRTGVKELVQVMNNVYRFVGTFMTVFRPTKLPNAQ